MVARVSNNDSSRGNGIDVARESVVSFGEAARYVGKLKGTKAIAFQTLWRWATKGCSGVVLETVCVGGTRCTSKEALQRFFSAVTRARASAPVSVARQGVGDHVGGEVVGDVDGVLRRAGIVDGEGGDA
jgi:hypothetical protein